MLKDKTTYYRKAHNYLDNASGRKEIARFWEKELKESIELKNPDRGVSVVTSVDSFITGEDFLFFNNSLSNFYTLRSERDNISRFALDFFAKNIESFRKLFFLSNNPKDVFYTLKFLSNHTIKKTSIPEIHLLDLYLIYLFAFRNIDKYSADMPFYDKLITLLVKGSVKYDFVSIAKRLTKNKELSNKLASAELDALNLNNELTGYIRGKLKYSGKLNASPYESVSILLFTDNYLRLLSEKIKGESLIEFAYKNKDELLKLIKARALRLLDNKNEPGSFWNEIETILAEKTGVDSNKFPVHAYMKLDELKRSPGAIRK